MKNVSVNNNTLSMTHSSKYIKPQKSLYTRKLNELNNTPQSVKKTNTITLSSLLIKSFDESNLKIQNELIWGKYKQVWPKDLALSSLKMLKLLNDPKLENLNILSVSKPSNALNPLTSSLPGINRQKLLLTESAVAKSLFFGS